MSNQVGKWTEICELAAKEQDPKKLLELTNEIIRLIDEDQKNCKSTISLSATMGVSNSTPEMENAT